MISRPSSQTSQPRPQAPVAGFGPVVLDEPDVVRVDVDAERLEAGQVQLLRVARVRLEDHLELGVGLQPVRVLAVAAVVGPDTRLDVRDPPRLGTEHPQDGRRVQRAGADLGVERLHDHAAAVGPVLRQREQRVLHGEHSKPRAIVRRGFQDTKSISPGLSIPPSVVRGGDMNNTLVVDDAELYYEVRGTGPLVVLVGAPMDADSFAPLADLLADDYTVLTTDPRGVNRSPLRDGGTSTPEQRADDLARLIRHVDAGPATVLGSSGGAVTVLALAQRHPDAGQHGDRPRAAAGPARRGRRRAAGQVRADDGRLPGRGRDRRLEAVLRAGEHPGAGRPIEGMFGGERDPQQVADERFWFAHEMRRDDHAGCRTSTRCATAAYGIVVGIGEESAGQLCDRTSTALADRLGITPTRFPGDHTGFADRPEPFATALRCGPHREVRLPRGSCGAVCEAGGVPVRAPCERRSHRAPVGGAAWPRSTAWRLDLNRG